MRLKSNILLKYEYLEKIKKLQEADGTEEIEEELGISPVKLKTLHDMIKEKQKNVEDDKSDYSKQFITRMKTMKII